VRLLHELAKIGATFDDPHLVSHAGLVPVMALAQRAGLADLAAEHVRIARPCGVNAPVKIACLAAGMAAGQTASMTWTCCVTVPCRCCSGISARRPRWGRSCGRSPGPSGTISSAAGSRRRDLGNGIHRLCLEQGQAHHRPAHRPPGQGPQPRRRPGPGRVGHRLAVPRGLHRLAVHLGPGRRAAPRPRSGRAGLRRLDRRPACAPALRYLPANAAWLALAAISCNLLRAAGALASLAYSNARGVTIRRDLIDVAAHRPARSRPPHPAPARGLVSRARMDEPVHRNLRLGPSFGQP